jgi:hypothetical protein
MTINTKALMDYTGYEFTQTNPGKWEWTEDGSNIGVRVELERVDTTEMLKVISHETNGYLLLMPNEIETKLRPAVDVMQYAAEWDQDEWPFDELAAVLHALDRDYGLSGYDGGLAIHCGFGMMFDRAGEGYVIYDEDGLTHFAGTPAQLAKLYPKVIAEQTRRNIGWINRNLKKNQNSEK